MKFRIVPALAMALAAVLPLEALAQSACAPEKLAAAIDRYSSAYAGSGFSARAWRMMKGLGDPDIEPKDAGSYYGGGDARVKFLGLAEAADPTFKLPENAAYGGNCLYDYPLQVLETRIKDLGKDHAYLKQWLAGQSAVFAACADSAAAAALPAAGPVDEKLRGFQTVDRDYQLASLAFYKGFKGYQFAGEAGRAEFQRIAASTSVHRAAARYMAAYVLAKAKQYKAARAETLAILADPDDKAIHPIARKLSGFIVHEENSAEGWTALLDDIVATLEKPAAAIEASEDSRDEYARALYDIDFMGIRGRSDDSWLTGKLPENPTLSKAIHDGARKHPMIAWMIAGQSMESAAHETSWQLAGAKWESRASGFLAAAGALAPGAPPLAKDALGAYAAGADDAARGALWSKANAAAKRAVETCGEAAETAAADTLLSQAARASARAGRYDEAYAGLDAASGMKSSQGYSRTLMEFGRFLAGKGALKEARAFRDKYLGASEPWAGSSYNSAISDLKLVIAEDAAHFKEALGGEGGSRLYFAPLNFLAAKALAELAGDAQAFTADERAFLARTAYARVYALGGVPDETLAKLMFDLNPALAALRDKVAADYPGIAPARLRLLTISHSPRFNILVNGPDTGSGIGDPVEAISADRNDRNWWCPFEPDRQLGFLRDQFDEWTGNGLPYRATVRADLAALIDPAVKADLDKSRERVLRQHPLIKAAAWKELRSLAAAPSAPKRLAERATSWAKAAKPEETAAAEALALSVRAARYGCNWHGSHKSYSKPAQELLKAKFGGTTWAAQTPYWFDCQLADRDRPADMKPGECPAKTWPKQDALR
jgi:hypothetical protein